MTIERRGAASGGTRWARVEQIFHAAADLPGEERTEFIARACDGDATLVADVERLLRADRNQGAVFSGLAPRVAEAALEMLETMADGVTAAWVGRSVGPYRVVAPLGEGGMGTVYRAVREDVDKEVALKVVRGSLSSPEILRRFLLERRVLARLAHPGIARLLDAGTTDDGTPWLVMDLVDGRPITRYCDEHALDQAARLRSFLQACDAVAYAHARLVVHRDIKPSNVFVDESGQVKLLDFGIAKLLEDGEESGETTRTGLWVFSPEYAAPEQVMGEPVTTATDVHALGVLLFELLSGERPYEVTGGTPAAAVRALTDSGPRRLSAVASVSERGGGNRGDLSRDLDAICLKALARDPEARYRSAQELADDVSRCLNGYPVEARLPTLRYRAAKFLRRNAVPAAGAALLVLALSGGLGAALWQGARARAALAESEEVASFLANLFEASDPAENRGRDVGARELLEEGVRRIDELGAQPRVQARMLEVMARAYHGLGENAVARELAQRSLAQRRSELGARHAEVAATLHTLGEIADELGERDASIAAYREALSIRRETLGSDDDATTFTMIRLARMLQLVGVFDEAEALVREALETRRAVHGPTDVATAAAMEVLGLVRRNGAGDLEQAESLFREALAIREATYGVDDPRLDPALVPLSTILAQRGKGEEGEVLIRRSIEIRRRIYGDDHPGIEYRMGSLGYVLESLGRGEESMAVYRDVLRRFREHYPGDYPYTATTLGNLGTTFLTRGQFDSALVYTTGAKDMWVRLDGEESPPVALAYHNMGAELVGLGRLAEAEEAYREAYTVRQTLNGENSPAALRTGSFLGDVMVDLGRAEEGEALLRDILVQQRVHYPEGDASVALTLERLAKALILQDRDQEAERLLSESLAYLRATVAPDHRHRARVAARMADFLSSRGRGEEADRIRQEEAAATDGAGG